MIRSWLAAPLALVVGCGPAKPAGPNPDSTAAGMRHSTYDNPLPDSLAASAATGSYSDGKLVKGRYHTYPEMRTANSSSTCRAG